MVFPTYDIEKELITQGYKYVVGTDEVGRGAAASSVVAAAVHMPENVVHLFEGKVNDSKKVSSKKREILYDLITEHCNVSVQAIEAEVIDDINILEATKLAMSSAVGKLEFFDYVLVDGTVDLSKFIKCPLRKIIKGDSISISIAAASIVAKVTRDRIMLELHKIWPIYGWNTNKGYLTKKHIEAINTYGITDYHRHTFKRVGR